MSLSVELKLPSQSADRVRDLERKLKVVAVTAGDVWTLTVADCEDDQCLLVARGGVQKDQIQPEWSPLAVEGCGATLRFSYSRVVHGVERDPALLARSVQRLLSAPSLRVASEPHRPEFRRSR